MKNYHSRSQTPALVLAFKNLSSAVLSRVSHAYLSSINSHEHLIEKYSTTPNKWMVLYMYFTKQKIIVVMDYRCIDKMDH